MNEIYEFLYNKNLLSGGKPNNTEIQRMSTAKILDIAQEAILLTPLNSVHIDKSMFSHSSSISLSGGRFPCAGLDCRRKHLKELAQFSAFYSDKVYIRNYFADYLSHDSNDIDDDTLKKRLHDDLSLYLFLQPLIENGNVVPVTPENFCVHCLVEKSLGKDADKRLERAEKRLVNRYNKEVEYSIWLDSDGALTLRSEGKRDLLEHPTTFVYKQIPDPIKSSPEILSRIQSGGTVRLTRSMVKQIEKDQDLADRTLRNIAFELATSQYLGTSFLTERTLDIETLNEITGDFEIQRRNQIIRDHLTCLVPILEGVDLSDMLELRNKEQDSFIIFRNALNQTIDEYIKNKKIFNEKDARLIYGDIIQPKLSKLNSTVRNSKKIYLKNVSAKLIAWGGAITLGVYAGFLPSELVASAAALGLVPLIAGLTNDILSQNTSEEQIRKEDFYFLWKMTH